MMRLLRPAHIGIFLRSFHSDSTHYARETIAKICSMWVALVTAPISQPGSCAPVKGATSRSIAYFRRFLAARLRECMLAQRAVNELGQGVAQPVEYPLE